MRAITKITQQKRNTERYNIFLDGEYAFAVDEAVFVQFALTKGKVLTIEEISEINYEDEVRKAFNRGLHFLSFRMRSEKEVHDKLKEHFGEAVIAEAIHKLKEYKFLDDEAFAMAFMNTKKNTSKQGPRAIQQTLKQKGIDEDTSARVLEQYAEEEQQELALALANKIVKQDVTKTPLQLKQKIQASLLRKGYSYAIINQAIETALEEETTDWEQVLGNQGDKIWDKHARKLTGFDLRMKVKQALYQKGFPSEVIEAFIETKEEN